MANILNSNPLIVDTAGAGSIKSTCWIDGIKWISPVGSALVTDDAGHVLFEGTTSNASIEGVRIRARGGIKVPTLGGGKLYIYLREGE